MVRLVMKLAAEHISAAKDDKASTEWTPASEVGGDSLLSLVRI